MEIGMRGKGKIYKRAWRAFLVFNCALWAFSGCGRREKTESPNIKGPCTTFDSYSTPTTGEVRMPVFLVDFPDERYGEDALSEEEMQEILFGDGEESMATFERNASYGQLQLSGDVRYYTAELPMEDYKNADNGFEMLAKEVLSAFDEELDYRDYDSDNNGHIDAFTLTIAGEDLYWYGCQSTWYDDEFCVDGVYPYYFIINDAQPYEYNKGYFVEEMCHEFGHCMGLPDYYKYDLDWDFEAMDGIAGTEMMDEMTGDYSQLSKLMLGWLKEDQVKVYRGGTQEYRLKSASVEGSCILVPMFPVEENIKKLIKGEYFLIQYDTAERNMVGTIREKHEGIRIFHVDAHVTTDVYGYRSFKYNGFSEYYDATHNGRRIIRLVNDGGGYFKEGAVIDYSVPGFAWYDEDGKETVNPGLRITVTGEGTVTIEQINP